MTQAEPPPALVPVPAVELARLLRRTAPLAAGRFDGAPYLRVVRLEWDGHLLHAVATDRFRVAWARYRPDSGGEGAPWTAHLPVEHARALVATWWQMDAEGGECGSCEADLGCCPACPEHAVPARGPVLLVAPIEEPGGGEDLGMLGVDVDSADLCAPRGCYSLAPVPACWPWPPTDRRTRSWRDLFTPAEPAEPAGPGGPGGPGSAAGVAAGTGAVDGAGVARLVQAYGEPSLVRFTQAGRLLRVDFQDQDFTGLLVCQRTAWAGASLIQP